MWNARYWDDTVWNFVCDELQSAWNIDSVCEKFRQNVVTKLIAATPFLARCSHPMRYAMAHLSVFIIGAKMPEPFALRPWESIESRYRPGFDFADGDQSIIDRSRHILELISVLDSRRDAQSDQESGKPNILIPDLAAEFDDSAVQQRFEWHAQHLLDLIDMVPCPLMDTTADMDSIRDAVASYRNRDFRSLAAIPCFWLC